MMPALPHRYPFVLLDRITALEPALGATAERRVSACDPLLSEEGVLAPPLLLEAMAQCAGIAAVGGGGNGMLVGFDRFRVAGRVSAGDSLDIRVRVVRRFGALIKARGRVRANGRLRAAAELTLRIE